MQVFLVILHERLWTKHRVIVYLDDLMILSKNDIDTVDVIANIERVLPALCELPKQLVRLILPLCLFGTNKHLLLGISISLLTDLVVFALPLRCGDLGHDGTCSWQQ